MQRGEFQRIFYDFYQQLIEINKLISTRGGCCTRRTTQEVLRSEAGVWRRKNRMSVYTIGRPRKIQPKKRRKGEGRNTQERRSPTTGKTNQELAFQKTELQSSLQPKDVKEQENRKKEGRNKEKKERKRD